MTISERLFASLEERKIEQKALASRLGIASATVTHWKQRNSDPPAKFIMEICSFLNITTTYLLTGEERAKKLSFDRLSDEAIEIAEKWEMLDSVQQTIIKGRVYEAYQMMIEKDGYNIVKSS